MLLIELATEKTMGLALYLHPLLSCDLYSSMMYLTTTIAMNKINSVGSIHNNKMNHDNNYVNITFGWPSLETMVGQI